MITARLAKKPYLEISKSAYEQLAKSGKKKVKISIVHDNSKERRRKKSKFDEKKISAFAERTLGIWVDDAKIEQAFNELEGRWQQWREEMLS